MATNRIRSNHDEDDNPFVVSGTASCKSSGDSSNVKANTNVLAARLDSRNKWGWQTAGDDDDNDNDEQSSWLAKYQDDDGDDDYDGIEHNNNDNGHHNEEFDRSYGNNEGLTLLYEDVREEESPAKETNHEEGKDPKEDECVWLCPTFVLLNLLCILFVTQLTMVDDPFGKASMYFDDELNRFWKQGGMIRSDVGRNARAEWGKAVGVSADGNVIAVAAPLDCLDDPVTMENIGS